MRFYVFDQDVSQHVHSEKVFCLHLTRRLCNILSSDECVTLWCSTSTVRPDRSLARLPRQRLYMMAFPPERGRAGDAPHANRRRDTISIEATAVRDLDAEA